MVDKNILNGKKHIHMIGIGGSGMYPLAQILHSQGYNLSGSDNNETETLDAVRKMGIKVYMGQAAENIEGADLIVYSAAIMADNPELVAAKARSQGVKVRFTKYQGMFHVFQMAGKIMEESGHAWAEVKRFLEEI